MLGSGDQSKCVTCPCRHDVRATAPGDGARAEKRVLRGSRVTGRRLPTSGGAGGEKPSARDRNERGRQVGPAGLGRQTTGPTPTAVSAGDCLLACQPLIQEEVPAGPRPRGGWLLRAWPRSACRALSVHLMPRSAPLINTARGRGRRVSGRASREPAQRVQHLVREPSFHVLHGLGFIGANGKAGRGRAGLRVRKERK